jgi:hypothetical protein
MYKNKGKLNAIATKNVSGIIIQQCFIFSFRLSYTIQIKKVRTTTEMSALIDFAGKLRLVSAIKFPIDASSAFK